MSEHFLKGGDDIDVAVWGFHDFSKQGCPIALDNYQRPYVWKEQRIQDLLADLESFAEAMRQSDPQSEYYMGTVALHRAVDREDNREKLFIIDGQQRLTSLCVLHHALHGDIPRDVELKFRSPLSVANVRAARELMRRPNLQKDIFDHLRFTVITVQSEDLAFTFFDTQNSRGVPLGATDLLKAYHLRAIHGDKLQQDERLRELCARRWERVQVQGEEGHESKRHDFAPELFHYYLWRARKWRGQSVDELEHTDDLLAEFQKGSLKSNVAQIKLYPAASNQWATALTLGGDGSLRLEPEALELQALDLARNPANLPFALRQPVQSGVGFFLYAEKYAALLNSILHQGTGEAELLALREFYRAVIAVLSVYLQSLFRLALLLYVDRLGTAGVFRFALWLNHNLGALRLDRDDVRRQTPLKYLRDRPINLLDVIAFAYYPGEVIAFLKSDDLVKSYTANDGWRELVVSGAGVKGRYIKALAGYYGAAALDKLHSQIDKHAETQLAKHKEGVHGRASF